MESWKEIGIGGVFAIMVIREVFGFLRSYKKNGSANESGMKPVDFWRLEFRSAIDERMGAHLTAQTQTLTDIRDGINKLVTLSEQRR